MRRRVKKWINGTALICYTRVWGIWALPFSMHVSHKLKATCRPRYCRIGVFAIFSFHIQGRIATIVWKPLYFTEWKAGERAKVTLTTTQGTIAHTAPVLLTQKSLIRLKKSWHRKEITNGSPSAMLNGVLSHICDLSTFCQDTGKNFAALHLHLRQREGFVGRKGIFLALIHSTMHPSSKWRRA